MYSSSQYFKLSDLTETSILDEYPLKLKQAIESDLDSRVCLTPIIYDRPVQFKNLMTELEEEIEHKKTLLLLLFLAEQWRHEAWTISHCSLDHSSSNFFKNNFKSLSEHQAHSLLKFTMRISPLLAMRLVKVEVFSSSVKSFLKN